MIETDPYGIDAHTPGAKLDAGKAPVHQGLILQFPRALEQVALLTEYGAEKYTWNGWQDVAQADTRYANARIRHELAIGRGEWFDPDSKLPHLVSVAWNALAQLELRMREVGP